MVIIRSVLTTLSQSSHKYLIKHFTGFKLPLSDDLIFPYVNARINFTLLNSQLFTLLFNLPRFHLFKEESSFLISPQTIKFAEEKSKTKQKKALNNPKASVTKA